MTKRNELVATAHLKKKGPKEILAVPVQKDRNKTYREKEKSDRDKGRNTKAENVDCLAERKVAGPGSKGRKRRAGGGGGRFKVVVLER